VPVQSNVQQITQNQSKINLAEELKSKPTQHYKL